MNEQKMKERQREWMHTMCIKPFCHNRWEIPNDLKLCIKCFKELEEIVGLNDIYDYSGKTPKVKMLIKEALQTLLAEYEDVIPTLKNEKVKGSNSQKRR